VPPAPLVPYAKARWPSGCTEPMGLILLFWQRFDLAMRSLQSQRPIGINRSCFRVVLRMAIVLAPVERGRITLILLGAALFLFGALLGCWTWR